MNIIANLCAGILQQAKDGSTPLNKQLLTAAFGALATIMSTGFIAAVRSGFKVFKWRSPSVKDIVLLAHVKDQSEFTDLDRKMFNHDGSFFKGVIAITIINSTDAPLYIANASFVPKQPKWHIGPIVLGWKLSNVRIHRASSRRAHFKVQPAYDLKFPARELDRPYRKDKLIRVNERAYTFIPLADSVSAPSLEEEVGKLGTIFLSYSTMSSFGSMQFPV